MKVLEVLMLILGIILIVIGVPIMIVYPETILYVVLAMAIVLLFTLLDTAIQIKRDKIYGSRFIRRP